ncbi:MAG: PIG-L family deacetylase [Phycisphaerae bacterium]|jgi:LmbE family N-acetylglucosaminyl deacetylase
MRILAVGAHPDDVEISCAGTLAQCVRRGDAVVTAVVCRGEMGGGAMPPEELVKIRAQENRDAARVLGAECIHLGLSDGQVYPTEANTRLFIDAIRQARPDVIITHYHADYGSDHNNTLILVRDASLYATVPTIRTRHPHIERIPVLYMMEPLAGFNFQPQVYVDITATFEVKRRMMACHRSQLEWLSRYGGMDTLKYIETVARFRGYQAQVELAEGFVCDTTFGRMHAGRVLP